MEDHLYLFARLRGVPEEVVEKVNQCLYICIDVVCVFVLVFLNCFVRSVPPLLHCFIVLHQ